MIKSDELNQHTTFTEGDNIPSPIRFSSNIPIDIRGMSSFSPSNIPMTTNTPEAESSMFGAINVIDPPQQSSPNQCYASPPHGLGGNILYSSASPAPTPSFPFVAALPERGQDEEKNYTVSTLHMTNEKEFLSHDTAKNYEEEESLSQKVVLESEEKMAKNAEVEVEEVKGSCAETVAFGRSSPVFSSNPTSPPAFPQKVVEEEAKKREDDEPIRESGEMVKKDALAEVEVEEVKGSLNAPGTVAFGAETPPVFPSNPTTSHAIRVEEEVDVVSKEAPYSFISLSLEKPTMELESSFLNPNFLEPRTGGTTPPAQEVAAKVAASPAFPSCLAATVDATVAAPQQEVAALAATAAATEAAKAATPPSSAEGETVDTTTLTTAAAPPSILPTITSTESATRSVEEESDICGTAGPPVDTDNYKLVDIIKPLASKFLSPKDKDKERPCESMLLNGGAAMNGVEEATATATADEQPGCFSALPYATSEPRAAAAADVSTSSPLFIPLSPLLQPFIFDSVPKNFHDSPIFPSFSESPWGEDPSSNNNLVVLRTFPAVPDTILKKSKETDPLLKEEQEGKETEEDDHTLVEKVVCGVTTTTTTTTTSTTTTTNTVGIPFITEGPAIGVMAMPMRLRHSIEVALNRVFRIKRARMNEEMENGKIMKESKRQKRDGGVETHSNASSMKEDSVATETSITDLDSNEEEEQGSVNSSKTRKTRSGRSASTARGREFKMLCQERKSRRAYAAGAGGNGKIDRRRKCATAPAVSESLSCGPIESSPPSGRRLSRRSSATIASNITPSNTIAPSPPASKTGMHGGDMITGPCEMSGVHLPISKEQILGRRGRSWNVQCDKLLEAFEEAYIVLGDKRIVKAQIFFQPIREIQSQYPDYAEKVLPCKPIDLLHVKRMLEEGRIDPRDFHDNVSMAFENWMRYFDDDENDNYRLAHRMQRLFTLFWVEIDRGESAIEASFQRTQNNHVFPCQPQAGMDLAHSLYPRRQGVSTSNVPGRQRRAGRPAARTRPDAEDLAVEMHEEILAGYKRLNERDKSEVTEWLNRGGDYAEIDEGDEWCFGIQSLKPRRRRALHNLVQKLVREQDNRHQAAGYNSGRRTQTSAAGMNTHRQHSGHQKPFPLATRREAGRNTGYDPALFSGNSSSDEPDEHVLPFRRNNPMPTPARFNLGEMDRETWQPSQQVVEHASGSLRPVAPNTIRPASRSPPSPSPFGVPRSFVPFSFAKPEKMLYDPSLTQPTQTSQGVQQTSSSSISSSSNLVGGDHQQRQATSSAGLNMQHGVQTVNSRSGANAGSRQANAGAGGSSAGYMQGTTVPGTGHPHSVVPLNSTPLNAPAGTYGAQLSHRPLGHEGNNNMGGIAQGQGQGPTHSTHSMPWNHGMEIGSHNSSTSHQARDDMANFGESRKMPGNEINKRPTAGYRSPQEGTYSMLDNADDVLAAFEDEIEGAWPGTETSYE